MNVYLARDAMNFIKPKFFDDALSASEYLKEELSMWNGGMSAELIPTSVEEMSVAEALNIMLQSGNARI